MNAWEQPGGVTLESNHGPSGYRTYSLKRQEYVADFCLAARRVLNDEDYKRFRYVFLLGADCPTCCRYLKMERGFFFHEVYRIESTLGRYMAELRPYPLYPVDEYMGGTVRAALAGRMPVGSVLLRKRRKRDHLPMTA